MNPRIAPLGFSIECNRFAPITREHDFSLRTLLRGSAMLEEARAAAPRMLGELPGFVADMDASGPWRPVPLVLAMAEPNGPVDQRFFDALLRELEAGLRQAGPFDGVYCVMHGAGLCTEDDDPEGTIQSLIRRLLGPRVPVVASFDLHANVSETDVRTLDAFIGYRTNPHMDMRERFHARLTPLGQAVQQARRTRDRSLPPLVFADVADNPGGGGRGNTMHLLEAFVRAGVKDALVGLIYDAALAREAHSIGEARVVVVKSRGYFRGGFDEFFGHDQVVEVDAPGLTSPILENFSCKHLPRPVVPLDAEVPWSLS